MTPLHNRLVGKKKKKKNDSVEGVRNTSVTSSRTLFFPRSLASISVNGRLFKRQLCSAVCSLTPFRRPVATVRGGFWSISLSDPSFRLSASSSNVSSSSSRLACTFDRSCTPSFFQTFLSWRPLVSFCFASAIPRGHESGCLIFFYSVNPACTGRLAFSFLLFFLSFPLIKAR